MDPSRPAASFSVMAASLLAFLLLFQTSPAEAQKTKPKSAQSKSSAAKKSKVDIDAIELDDIELDDDATAPRSRSRKSTTPGRLVKGPTKGPAKATSRLQWDAGLTTWTEKTRLVSSAGKEHDVVSNAAGMLIGIDWRRDRRHFGWVYQLGLVYANINSESQSATITYQKGRDLVYGAHGGAGFFVRLPDSSVEVSLLAQAKYRQANYTTPDGYSFGNDSSIVAGFAEIDLMMPLSDWLTIFQQYSASLWDRRMDSTWVIGLRI